MNDYRKGPSSTYYFAAVVFLLSAITSFSKENIKAGIGFLVLTAVYIVFILLLKRYYKKREEKGNLN